MRHLPRFVAAGLVVAGLLLTSHPAFARVSSWTDAKGASFRGEPVQVLGPYALFRTSGGSGRRVPFRAMSDADCRRFYEEIAAHPARAASFAAAKGDATADLVGRMLRVENRQLVPADLTQVPEPELLLLLFGSHNDGEGWIMTANLSALHLRVQRVFPGLMQTVFLGVRHNASEHRQMATEAWMPWLVADFSSQQSMSTLWRYQPGEEGTNMVLLTREGVPLAAARATDVAAMRVFEDQVSELLWSINPTNPVGWVDELHYLNAVRPVQFAHGRAEPLLVGNPLRGDGLRRYGVKRVLAKLAVAPDGKVTPTLTSGPDDVPASVAPALEAALRQAAVVPAIENGQPVAGTLDYALEVPAPNPTLAADELWLASAGYPVVPIERWLVLRPIMVSEKDFEGGVQGVTESGTVILKSMEVNSGKISRAAQMSAFNTDFFAESGPGAVAPKEGDRQRIDADTELKWEVVRSKDGYVDLQSGLARDYTVGYAWAEFEMPADTPAWLGLGSDDGVKIWLNGELVQDKWVRRMSRIDDDVVPLRLKKGPNRILIKIQNATGDWSFVYRLRVRPGK